MDIVTLSGIRKELLFYLEDGPRSLSEIREHLGITSPEVSPRIKELLEHHLICYEDKKYQLTAIGRTIIKNFKPFINTTNVFDQYPDWWEAHDVSAIPEEKLFQISELKNFFIIEDDLDNDNRTAKEMFHIIKNSKSLIGVTCTFRDEYPELFLSLVKNNIPTSLIVTDKIYKILEKNYRNQLNNFLASPNSELYVSKENIQLSQIVTNDHLFFSLSYKNGKFDFQSNLVSNDPSSIKWGLDIFEYYKINSVRVNNNNNLLI